MTVLELRDICKTYEVKPPLPVLMGVDLDVEAGEKIAIIGHSGAGKSTLLNIIGLLDAPTAGSYRLSGRETEGMRDRDRDALRANVLGFVFQDYHVLGHRTVSENLEIKLAITGLEKHKRQGAMTRILEQVGLQGRAHAPARLLSGGEKQRLAIARAMVTEPQVLLADEPTGNLDEENARTILDLFDVEARRGVAVVVITHDERIHKWADRVLHLADGKLHE